MKNIFIFIIVLCGVLAAQNKTLATNMAGKIAKGKSMETKLEKATLGAGCFWCVEAIYQRLEGVEKVESGYSGGHVKDPSYEDVCTGRTGHAEVIQVTFDPKKLSFKELLEVFFRTHDPTTLNRQGADVGTQYRSAIFYHTDEQKKIAEQVMNETNAAKIWDNPIVTEISQFIDFYKAEEYHQNYYNENSYKPYCMMVINPKLSKFRKEFSGKLKKETK
ncbi:MAG: peptide-methionine (S)-S-oxide reductase MsrA [Ignavibacteriales bacterium]|nr:peptide-methionine (S)-S-oxide reductase MsrA [Ignavibacteriales bacterium]